MHAYTCKPSTQNPTLNPNPLQAVSELRYRAEERAPRPEEKFDVFMTRTALEMEAALADETPFVTIITNPTCLRLISARSSSGQQTSAPYAVFFPSKRIVIKERADPRVAARDIATDLERLSMYKAPLCEECGGAGIGAAPGPGGPKSMSTCPDCGTPVCDACVTKRAIESTTLAALIACDVCYSPAPVALRAMTLGARGECVGNWDAVWRLTGELAAARGGAIVFAFNAVGHYGRARVDGNAKTTEPVDGDSAAFFRLQNIAHKARAARVAVFELEGKDWMYVFDCKDVSGAGETVGRPSGGDGASGSGTSGVQSSGAETRWFAVVGADNLMRGLYGAIRLARTRRGSV